MPTESYGEFGLNGIGAGDGDDVPGPSCGPLAWVTASRRSGSGSRARCGSKQHSAVWIKIDFEFFLNEPWFHASARLCARHAPTWHPPLVPPASRLRAARCQHPFEN